MDSLLGFPVYMDFEGQKLAERLFQAIIVIFGAIGWLYGYYVQDFFMTVLTLGAGFVLACLVTLPPWPIYRRHPLSWLAVQEVNGTATPDNGGKKQKKKN